MNILTDSEVFGDIVNLKRTNPRHMPGSGDPVQAVSEKTDFSSVLFDALDEANTLQQESTALTEAFITDPDNVDVHDVTIAMSKANLAVSITKAVVDGALKAYREIINMR